MKILAFITDLFFQAKVAETAKQVGASLETVTSLYKFIPALQKTPDLILIDLEAEGISGPALISQIKEANSSIPVIAYVSHVKDDLREQAEKSGADKVLPRSKFSETLPDLLSGLAEEDSEG